MSLPHKIALVLLGTFGVFPAFAQTPQIDVLQEKLSRIDTLLLEDKDSLARVALDQLDFEDFKNEPPLVIQYHQFNGDYFLHVSDNKSAVAAYEPLLEISTGDLDKASTLRLARGINDLGIAYMRVGELAKAKDAHFRSLVLYDRFNDPMGGSFNYNNLALIYKEQKQTDSAIYFHRLSMESARTAKDTLGVGFNLMNLAILYTDTKQLVKALDHYHRSLDVFKSLKNDRMVNAVNRRLGTYYMRIRDNESAKPLLMDVLEYSKKNNQKTQIGVTHNRLAELYENLEQYDSMFYHVQLGLKVLKETNYSKGIGASYHIRGSYHFESRNYDIAQADLDSALSFTLNRWRGSAVSSIGAKARIHMAKGKPQLAIKSFEQALEQVGGDRNEVALSGIYATLSRAYKQVGNEAAALDALEQYNRMRARVLDDEKRWEIARIEYRNFLEREKAAQQAEQDRLEAEYQQSLRNKQLTIYSILALLVFAAIAAALYYRSYRIKRKANQLLEEKNGALQELRKKEAQLASEKIASKERELATMAMATHEKNNILHDLRSKIDGIESGTGSGDLKDIKKTINNSLSLDESWDSFLHRFEDVHPQFFDQLKAKNQNLTINDLKLSAYLKIGMNNKEIANVTFLTLGSVKSQINRLKKKLQLGPEDNIRDFMLQRV